MLVRMVRMCRSPSVGWSCDRRRSRERCRWQCPLPSTAPPLSIRSPTRPPGRGVEQRSLELPPPPPRIDWNRRTRALVSWTVHRPPLTTKQPYTTCERFSARAAPAPPSRGPRRSEPNSTVEAVIAALRWDSDWPTVRRYSLPFQPHEHSARDASSSTNRRGRSRIRITSCTRLPSQRRLSSTAEPPRGSGGRPGCGSYWPAVSACRAAAG